MRMMGRPDQHRAGDGKVIVLPLRTMIDRAGVTIFRLKGMKLRKGAAHH